MPSCELISVKTNITNRDFETNSYFRLKDSMGEGQDNVAEQTEKILGTIANNDPLAIKTAYHALFDSVVVSPENDQGIRTIKYVLSDESHEDGFGPRSEMVEVFLIKFS